jgi:hypothetical protein
VLTWTVVKLCALSGLLGGYSFYDHDVNVRILPLTRILDRSLDERFHLHLPENCIAFATSYEPQRKWYAADDCIHTRVGEVMYVLWLEAFTAASHAATSARVSKDVVS